MDRGLEMDGDIHRKRERAHCSRHEIGREGTRGTPSGNAGTILEKVYSQRTRLNILPLRMDG